MFNIITNTKLTENEKCEAIVAKVLQDPGALTKTWLGLTPMHLAVSNRLPKVVAVLLKLGCSIDAEDCEKQTPLHHAAENGMEELILMLGYFNCNFNKVDNKHESALHKAIINGHPSCVENLLIASNFTIDKTLKNKDGHTAEDLLRKNKNIKVQVTLATAFTKAPDLFKRTPLQLAVISNSTDLVQLRLKLGAPINEQDSEGRTALHFAALCGHLPILLMLCYHDEINMNLVDKEGNTALHSSIEAGHPDCVKVLVSANNPANKYIKNNDHLTPLDLIKKWQSKKEVVIALQQALLSTQLCNGLTEEHEKEVFTFNQSIPSNYMLYLEDQFKELELSIKTLADERTSSHSDGHTFKLFRSLSTRKQSTGESKSSRDLSSSDSTISEKETIEEDTLPPRRKSIRNSKSPREKSNLSSPELTMSDKEASGRDTPPRKKSITLSKSPREKSNLSSSELTMSDKEASGRDTPPRKKSITLSKSPREKVNISNIEPATNEKETIGEDTPLPMLRRKSITRSNTLRGKLDLSKAGLTISNKETIIENDSLEKIYLENDVQALVDIIKKAQTDHTLIPLTHKLEQFLETHHNKGASNFLSLVFSELKPILLVEQKDFDKKCTSIQMSLHKKLLFDGLKKICRAKEINKITRAELLSISDQEETIKNLQALVELCNGEANGASNVIINLDSATVQCLGLMDFVEPEEIIALLIKLNPLFSTIQRVQSHYLVFTLVELHDFYGYDSITSSFAKQVHLYTQNCCEIIVSQLISDYIQTVHAFKTNSLHAVIKRFSPLLEQILESKQDSILDKINDFMSQSSISLKHKSIQSQVYYITREFNIINARFYQSCSLKEFRQKSWEAKNHSHTVLSEFVNITNGMTTFVKKTICAYEHPQKQAQAITLFILVARESLHYQYGSDLITLMAISIALRSTEVSCLKDAFELLDKNTLKILDALFTLTHFKKNHSCYRKLIEADQRAFPYIGIIFGDKIHIYDKNLHENLIFLGQLYQSLIVIKNNLHYVSLTSHSDLLERLQELSKKNNEVDEKNTTELKENMSAESSSQKYKNLSLFSSNPQLPNLDTSSTKEIQNHPGKETLGEVYIKVPMETEVTEMFSKK